MRSAEDADCKVRVRYEGGGLCWCSWWTQFRVLLKRAMLGQLRNPTDTTSRLFLSTWVGCLAGAHTIVSFHGSCSHRQCVSKRVAASHSVLRASYPGDFVVCLSAR